MHTYTPLHTVTVTFTRTSVTAAQVSPHNTHSTHDFKRAAALEDCSPQ